MFAVMENFGKTGQVSAHILHRGWRRLRRPGRQRGGRVDWKHNALGCKSLTSLAVIIVGNNREKDEYEDNG
jgi:hypothetical protein